MIFGCDTLGLAKYPDIIKHWVPGFACGVFASEFGDAFPVVRKLLASGKCPAVRVQICWGGRLHQYGDKDIPAIKREARRYQKLAKQFPKIDIYLSPFCEHNLEDPSKYLQIIDTFAPSCIPVNTVWKGKQTIAYVNEVHGDDAKVPKGKFLYSYDGDASNQDPNIERMKERMKNAGIFYTWTPAFNGLEKDEYDPDEVVPPIPKRWNWATKEHLEAMKFLTGEKEP